MSGQPLVVWDRAEGFNVFDRFGNKWLDFSSGVLVTNSGHGNEAIKQAIIAQAEHGLLHNYCFPTEVRTKLVKKLSEIAPDPLKKVFLLRRAGSPRSAPSSSAAPGGRRWAEKRK